MIPLAAEMYEQMKKQSEEEEQEREEQETKQRNLRKIQAAGGMGFGGLFGGANPASLRGNLKSAKSLSSLLPKSDQDSDSSTAPEPKATPKAAPVNPMAGFNPAALKSGLRTRGATVANRKDTKEPRAPVNELMAKLAARQQKKSVEDEKQQEKEDKSKNVVASTAIDTEPPKLAFALRKTASKETLTGERPRAATIAAPAVNNELLAKLKRRQEANGEQ